MLKVFISILNYNGQVETDECLKSLDHLIFHEGELIVVVLDNGSKEPYKTDKKYTNFKLITIYNQTNTGFSGGHNRVIDLAMENEADFVMVLNNDTLVAPHLLQNLIKPFASHEKVGITVPKIYFAKGSEYHQDRYSDSERGKVIWYAGGIYDRKNVLFSHRGVDEVDKGQFDQEEETFFATGCCILLSRNALLKVEGFDEDYFLYLEDSDLSMRIKLSGLNIYYVPDAVLWHKNAVSAGGSGSALQDYYITRNRLYFGERYSPLRAKLALFRESLKLLFKGRPMQRKGVIDFYLRRVGKGKNIDG